MNGFWHSVRRLSYRAKSKNDAALVAFQFEIPAFAEMTGSASAAVVILSGGEGCERTITLYPSQQARLHKTLLKLLRQ